jgi:cytoskeleton protein RodZ
MTEPQDTNNTPAVANSAGAMIRAAREKQGLHIAALAAAIKVAPRKLDALENDRWGDLPDATFTRALAQTVCRTLKIDAAPVLERLPAQGSMSLAPGGQALNEPFRERPGREDPSVGGLAIRPMVWAAGLLMLAALALYLAPSQWWTSAPRVVTSPGAPAVSASPVATTGAVTAAADAALQAPAAAALGASGASGALGAASAAFNGAVLPAGAAFPQPSSGASSAANETVFLAPPATVGGGAVAAATPTATPAPAPTPTPTPTTTSAAKAGSEALTIRTQRAAWVEVRDATGQVLVRDTVAPTAELKLTGTPPFKVVMGNAAATQLQFRGQSVDVVGRSQGNVARFDLP